MKSFKLYILLLVTFSFFMIVLWIFRPKSSDKYKKFSEIPLYPDNEGKNREGR